MTISAAHMRFRKSLGLPPTATADRVHVQTRQPDPGAMSYAYTQLGLVMYDAIGSGDRNRKQWMYEVPYSYQPFQVATFGLGGIVMGSSLMTQLLLSQADAVARGLLNPPTTTGNLGGSTG